MIVINGSSYSHRLQLICKNTFESLFVLWEDIVNRSENLGFREDGRRQKQSNMAYTAQHIANYFLEKSEEEFRPVTQLKLLKLIYIAYGWQLALNNEKLFHEPIEAWQHGPVIRSIYHEFKHFGKRTIDERSLDIFYDEDDEDETTPLLFAPEVNPEDVETRFVLDKVWAAYRNFSGWQLREKTHEDNGPWHKVYRENSRGVELKDDDIRNHYIHRIRQYLDAAA